MNLYLFPEAPVCDNGFGIAVADAYERLEPKPEDIVVWYSTKDNFPQLQAYHILIKKLPQTSPRRIMNVLCNRPSHELSTASLAFLKDFDFEHIHCDDTTFFRTLRSLFPDKHITVRFHNSYARIEDRRRLLKPHLSMKFKMVLKAYYNLERDIMNDRNSTKIFLTKEDCNYYRSHVGITSDSKVWPGMEAERLGKERRRLPVNTINMLVWFGGIESHKISSVYWFVNNVLPKIRIAHPNITLQLYGGGTKQFHSPDNGVYGHGRYNGNDFPHAGESLYINPDIIGGGIKLKLYTYLKAGVPFITTPFGFEGYPSELIDDYCIVSEQEKWIDDINCVIERYG